MNELFGTVTTIITSKYTHKGREPYAIYLIGGCLGPSPPDEALPRGSAKPKHITELLPNGPGPGVRDCVAIKVVEGRMVELNGFTRAAINARRRGW